MDLLSMEDQLRLITQADVVVGMHGAGLAHVLMMQRNAVLIELVPNYYGNGNNHFADLARWRGVSYIKWANTDRNNEKGNYMTHIPLSVMDELLTKAVGHLCEGDNRRNSEEPLYVVNGDSRMSFLQRINPIWGNLRVVRETRRRDARKFGR